VNGMSAPRPPAGPFGRFARGVAASLVVAAAFGLGRLLTPAPSRAPADVLAELTAALAVGVTLTWAASMAVGSPARRASALGLVLFASIAAVMLEGAAFAPSLSPIDRLPAGLAAQLVVSAAVAWVAAVAVPVRSARDVNPAHADLPARGRLPAVRVAVAVAVAGGAVVYVVAYFVSGSINYLLVTGPYYASHAAGLTRPDAATVLAVAMIEGVLLSIGVVPLSQAVPGSSRSRGMVCGLVLWSLGGLVPLLLQPGLPEAVRVASLVEILVQKVPLGLAVVGVLAARRAANIEPSRRAGVMEVRS
jgi:hypothetical protein